MEPKSFRQRMSDFYQKLQESIITWLDIIPSSKDEAIQPGTKESAALAAQPKQSLGIFRKTKKAYLWAFVISAAINILALAMPIYMLQVYERVLPSQRLETLIYLTVITLFALAIFAFLSNIRTHLLADIGRWIELEISKPVFERSLHGVVESDDYPTSAFNDIQSVSQFLGGPAMGTLLDFPWSPIYFIVIFAIHPILGVFSVILAGAIFSLIIINEKWVKQDILAHVKMQKTSQAMMDFSLRDAEVLQAMGISESVTKRWIDSRKESMILQKIASKKGEKILSWVKFARVSGQILILGIGAWLAVQGEVTSGAMIAASILMSRGLAPIEQSISIWKQFVQARDAYKRITEFLTRRQAKDESMSLPPPTGHIKLENVHFTFPKREGFILHQINLEIPPGTSVALIGPSASGKTTLCRLLLGILKPSIGKVYLDGANMYQRSRSEIGPYIGYLPQDIELFPDTIKANIARLGEVNPEEVVNAAKLAGAHDMILQLPNGYETMISKWGTGLSLGQLQRIGLARALYGSPKLVVLDEPDSNLDSEGEKALFRSLAALKQAKVTTLLISHHAPIIRLVDQIVVLEQGRIKHAGPRDEIIEILQKKAQEAQASQQKTQQQAQQQMQQARQQGGEESQGKQKISTSTLLLPNTTQLRKLDS